MEGFSKQNAEDDTIFGSKKRTNKMSEEKVMRASTVCVIQ
jgi:hypothetical protein